MSEKPRQPTLPKQTEVQHALSDLWKETVISHVNVSAKGVEADSGQEEWIPFRGRSEHIAWGKQHCSEGKNNLRGIEIHLETLALVLLLP